jgi:hypothetical protein
MKNLWFFPSDTRNAERIHGREKWFARAGGDDRAALTAVVARAAATFRRERGVLAKVCEQELATALARVEELSEGLHGLL